MDPFGANPSMCFLNEGFTSVVHDDHAISGDNACDGNPEEGEDWVSCICEIDPTKVLEVSFFICEELLINRIIFRKCWVHWATSYSVLSTAGEHTIRAMMLLSSTQRTRLAFAAKWKIWWELHQGGIHTSVRDITIR